MKPEERPTPEPRSTYFQFQRIPTRWADNDVYGHVNNVMYYAWFDTAVNTYLIEQGALDIHQGTTIGLVIETHCNYFAPVSFPESVEIGIRVGKLGKSSVRYELGVFTADADAETKGQYTVCAAKGHFIHVYVDKASRRPVQLPLNLQAVLEKINSI